MTLYRTLSIETLERDLQGKLAPTSVDTLLRRDPAVKEALQALEKANETEQGLRKEFEKMAEQFHRAERELAAWCEANPWKAWLHETGSLKSTELTALYEQRTRIMEQSDVTRTLITVSINQQEACKKELSLAREQGRPEAERTHALQQERYQEAKALYDERYVQERVAEKRWEQQLEKMSEMSLSELRREVSGLCPEVLCHRVARVSAVKEAERNLRTVVEEQKYLERERDNLRYDLEQAREDLSTYRKEHGGRVFLHETGVLPDKTLLSLIEREKSFSEAVEKSWEACREITSACSRADTDLMLQKSFAERALRPAMEEDTRKYEQAKEILKEREEQEKAQEREQGHSRERDWGMER
jgi:hypothetical protein